MHYKHYPLSADYWALTEVQPRKNLGKWQTSNSRIFGVCSSCNSHNWTLKNGHLRQKKENPYELSQIVSRGGYRCFLTSHCHIYRAALAALQSIMFSLITCFFGNATPKLSSVANKLPLNIQKAVNSPVLKPLVSDTLMTLQHLQLQEW